VLGLRSTFWYPARQFPSGRWVGTTRLSEADTRVLALQSFLDTYREHLAQEAQPDATGIDMYQWSDYCERSST